MRTGLVVSLIGHAVVLFWGLIAFPSAQPFSVEPVDALPVDLVPIEEVTKTRVGDKTASKDNPSAPKPADKPVEAPKKASDPGKKPTESAKAAPAKSEPKKVAEAPPPEPPAEPDPAPEPAKEPEPAPEPQTEAEPAPAQEEAPKEAEKAPEPPKPVNVVPQSKPTPPRRTQTAALDPAKTQNAREQEEEKKFDPNEISNLLNKVKPEGGERTVSEEPAGLGATRATQQQGLSASQLDLLVSKIKERWNYVPDAFPPDLVVVVQFELTRDGHLAGTPRIMNSNPYPRFRQIAEAAVRAIIAVDRSEGFSFLPRDRYDGNGGWNTVLANLKPQ
ncbi:cell division and transport-associated protein TolA [Breoghania corrubedonensis]|uniref:Cell division and transport-associated protein TolA n=1 Tax=Breoghania corrubedonensis TaxID=665038 RepID=A0A2T5V7E9_9HYPH|nr:cell envelope biogenesis protein TolA [Breoghania corrubedonensis]PTW59684.1 cell division and transport-associated protein TolA [Breoghania corrubedonensis]